MNSARVRDFHIGSGSVGSSRPSRLIRIVIPDPTLNTLGDFLVRLSAVGCKLPVHEQRRLGRDPVTLNFRGVRGALGVATVVVAFHATPLFACDPFNTASCSSVVTFSGFYQGPGSAPVHACSTAGSSSVPWITGVGVNSGFVTFTIASQNLGDFGRWGLITLQCDQILVLQCAHGNQCTFRPAITLLDPVPDLLDGPTVETSDTVLGADLLATQGRMVQGVAADGVTELVVRVPAMSVGDQYVLTLLDDTGGPSRSADEDGALGNPGDATFSLDQITITAVGTTNSGPFAFAVYRAPTDFARPGNTQDPTAVRRNVSIQVQNLTGGTSSVVPITIVRPPVALIHGIWSDPSTWRFFTPLISDARFKTFRVNYGVNSGDGFATNASITLPQLGSFIQQFKADSQVAAVQVDAVAHSMGGDIIRTLVLRPFFLRDANYQKGDVHKLVTLDTPYSGSQFATRLLASNSFCQDVFALNGKPVAGAVTDLAVGSPALQGLRVQALPIPAHAISGIASTFQAVTADLNASISGLTTVCPTLLPAGGFRQVFGGPSDLIVSQSSQEATGLAFSGSGGPPVTAVDSIIHAVDTTLFTAGPDALSRNVSNGQVIMWPTGNPDLVIDLLNKPVTDRTWFRPIRP